MLSDLENLVCLLLEVIKIQLSNLSANLNK